MNLYPRPAREEEYPLVCTPAGMTAHPTRCGAKEGAVRHRQAATPATNYEPGSANALCWTSQSDGPRAGVMANKGHKVEHCDAS
jgi:hypothetical protein